MHPEKLHLFNYTFMERTVWVLKTNITSKKKVQLLEPAFRGHEAIHRWTVDTTDVDNVLRIEARPDLCHEEIIALVKNQGFYCEELAD